jgi:uncharacterized OsmC-like protein
VRGEVGKDEGILVIRRIHVVYRLRVDEEHRETVERVHGAHHRACPVYRTLEPAIEITTEVRYRDD